MTKREGRPLRPPMAILSGCLHGQMGGWGAPTWPKERAYTAKRETPTRPKREVGSPYGPLWPSPTGGGCLYGQRRGAPSALWPNGYLHGQRRGPYTAKRGEGEAPMAIPYGRRGPSAPMAKKERLAIPKQKETPRSGGRDRLRLNRIAKVRGKGFLPLWHGIVCGNSRKSGGVWGAGASSNPRENPHTHRGLRGAGQSSTPPGVG